MATHYRSKIQAAAERRGDGSFGDLGPGALAVGEWQAEGLELPELEAMRAYRLGRLRAELRARDYAGLLLTDPINLRYATDSTNFQVWCLHNPVRYAFIATEGPVVLFDFRGARHISAHLPLIDELRPATSWFYFETGEHTPAAAAAWAAELADLVALHGGGNRRLAVDKLDRLGVHGLEALGLTLADGQEVCERARARKSVDEIRAMRCALSACAAGMAAMQQALRPGVTEQELWAHLHAENIKRGGEWIETRLLSSGQRTNPWYQECSSRVIEPGELVAFDTDLIGPYGYCADISRSWLCEGRPDDRQRAMYRLAHEQLAHNTALLRPGLGFFEFAERAFKLPERYRPQRYSVVLHGVGLADEYPAIYYAEDAAHAYDHHFEAGMTVCVEAYLGEVGGPDGIKLEQQLLITEQGAELLSHYPLEPDFLR